MDDKDDCFGLCMRYSEYPLKSTVALPIDDIFQQHITQTLGGNLAWLPVSQIFKEISKLRGELMFD